ncbi:PREDICTED: cylicin-1 [Ceratotherium simum simum]|uniref:Cylicin-1 n=1 Tax=Ceratotherium simum simum TaxID=73337 RepID=A0ABM1D7R6_CERSS|nr:PREDICTED: cylicin-1 [Ceratotherium simum simum]
MSLPRLCLRELINEDIQIWNSLCRPEVNIRTYDNVTPISESRRTLWNQEYFTMTFPKPPQPGRKKISRPSELQITVPRHDKRKLEEVQKPAHIWIRHSLRKIFQRPSIYLTARRRVPFRHPYTPQTHSEKAEYRESKDIKKGTTLKKDSMENTGPHETTLESKKTVNEEKSKRGNKVGKTPSKSLHESELYKKSKSKSEINPYSIDSKMVSMIDPKKDKRDSKNSKETDIESICTKKDSKSSKNNSDAKSETCSKDSSNIDLMMYLEESGAESMELDMWLKNYSQNNSKKPSKDSKKDAKKSSDAESVDSKDAKKDKKMTKKDTKKKDAKKDTESTDAESVDSKDAKKDPKNAKKDSKKKDAKKDAVSTDAESESELESKKDKKDEKKDKKGSKKDDKKKEAKKDTASTDADSESEGNAKKGKKDEKKGKKDDKKQSAMKSEESTETESDWESKKDKSDSKAKKDSKKDAKKQDAKKDMESTDAEFDASSKKDPKKSKKLKSSDAESEESLYKPGAKKRGADESDATSTDSKKEALELKREFKISSKKTTFKEKGKKSASGIPPSRERPPLPPCEPLLPSPKVKRLCQCKMPPPPPKPRYAPLPEAKWIHKLL